MLAIHRLSLPVQARAVASLSVERDPLAATDHAGTCAYPHQPQADARDAGIVFVAIPVSRSTDTLQPALAEGTTPVAAAHDPAPPVPLPVQYCRLLE